MGCAFSSSTQIFVIDAGRRSRRPSAENGISWNLLFSHVRQGLISQQRRPSKIAGSAAFWLSKTKGGNDAVLVGQLKSNGAYSRRRPSSEAQFIEHRSRISLRNGLGTANGNAKMLGTAVGNGQSRQNGGFDSRKPSSNAPQKSPNMGNNGQAPHYGLMDFQRRLERLKARKFEERSEIEGANAGENPQNGEAENSNANGHLEGKMPQEKMEGNEPPSMGEKTISMGKGPPMMMAANGGIGRGNLAAREPVEPLIVKHLAANGELSGDEQQLDDLLLNDGELWREWDESGADCCSIQIGANQMAAWHDGEVSEASFVLVKKRLKVAWEHRQLQQMRKLSLMRRESAGIGRGDGMGQSRAASGQMVEATKRNNWIPEISQVDE